ncbi:MAG: 4a-hydroxytetrahydrobiopterin dehydratase [Cyanobacteriota/Melainabacteria group bacterium]
MSLAKKGCKPCRGDSPVLAPKEIDALLKEVDGWSSFNAERIEKSYSFPDFMGAMELANKIALIAEQEGHHPDLHIRWGELRVEIWTHAVNGLTENDFILAAKIDDLS